jgi:hypothetical protein
MTCDILIISPGYNGRLTLLGVYLEYYEDNRSI